MPVDETASDPRGPVRLITLYGPRNTPFVQKVALGLALKKLHFDAREPAGQEDYRRWNPATGTLPVLDLDGERIADSTAILKRLDELHPHPPLLSRDPRMAEAQLHLVEWVEETFGWYWTRWNRLRDEDAATADAAPSDGSATSAPETAPPRPAGVSLRSWLGGRLRRAPESKATGLDRVSAEVRQRIGDTERLLADRAFFYSDEISMADLAVYTMLKAVERGNLAGRETPTRDHPQLQAFMDRVEKTTGG